MTARSRGSVPIIQLSGRAWNEPIDFVDALKGALGAIRGCGSSVDAMIDLMVYGGMSRIEPPYVVRISDVAKAPQAVRDHIFRIAQAVSTARQWKEEHYGEDVEVSIEISL
jgi:hypothetical protein